ncbi:hypothetical protein OCU04_010378 [Sclerotinia nivalis]|uniref:Uncharacterized protein n=1 Tax=Sclerotinia nivalis TaxID=352851 RepID=A0A9X0AEJ5_9HELO|nr:hypothetical protein OCU04_010378 [Sclerotinia nivalis]
MYQINMSQQASLYYSLQCLLFLGGKKSFWALSSPGYDYHLDQLAIGGQGCRDLCWFLLSGYSSLCTVEKPTGKMSL